MKAAAIAPAAEAPEHPYLRKQFVSSYLKSCDFDVSDNLSMAWRDILMPLLADVGRKKLSLMAAGIAFYGILSLAPCISALVSLYGLVYNPTAVEPQVTALSGIVPEQALDLIADELAGIVGSNHSQLGIGLVVSMAIALGAATKGTSALMMALNAAYDEEEKRGLIGYYAYALLLAVGLLLFGTFSFVLLAAMPAILDLLPVGTLGRTRMGALASPGSPRQRGDSGTLSLCPQPERQALEMGELGHYGSHRPVDRGLGLVLGLSPSRRLHRQGAQLF
jgi:hypothetical protein